MTHPADALYEQHHPRPKPPPRLRGYSTELLLQHLDVIWPDASPSDLAEQLCTTDRRIHRWRHQMNAADETPVMVTMGDADRLCTAIAVHPCTIWGNDFGQAEIERAEALPIWEAKRIAWRNGRYRARETHDRGQLSLAGVG